MKSTFLKPILSAGLFLLPVLSLHATPDTVLKVDVKCYFQAKTSISKDKQKGDVDTVRLNSKQLLKLIAREKGAKFPNGSQLIVNEAGGVAVFDSKGNFIMDASPYVTLVFSTAKQLVDGTRDLDDGKENTLSFYPIALKLKLSTAKGTLRGVAIEHTRVSSPDRDGIQVTRVDLESAINGKGEINGGFGCYEGEIKLEGREAVIR